MLNSELFDRIFQVRSADYDSNSSYYEQLQMLLQESERLQFKNHTKYLAKKYFDIFLTKRPSLPDNQAILVIITCLRTAAKFNETVDISDHYTIEYCQAQCGGQFSRKDFLDCELQLLMCLSFKLNMTSPYDFVVVEPLLPHSLQSLNILNTTIDFALSIPQLRTATAQGIFFGALLYSCKEKKEGPLAYKIIQALTHRWNEAQQIALILESTLNQILQE